MASTIKDIKSETGLALATISKYLNGGNVLEENREKIEAAIKKLDYRPNETARALITKRTRSIGFVINDIASQFSGVILRHTGDLLRKQGYSMMICDSAHDEKLEKRNIHFCIDKKVDGILVLPVSRDPQFLEPAAKAGIPVVLLDREVNGGGYDCVTIDNRAAAVRAVNLLIGHGHRQIAIIHSEEYTGYERYMGYLEGMRAAGLDVPEEYIRSGPRHSTELGYEGMKALTCLKNPPTAVLMTNYELGLGVVMALNQVGLRCPEDISLVGFDDLILTLVIRPRISVISQPMEEISREAVRLLMQKVKDSTVTTPYRISMFAPLKNGESVRDLRK